MRTNCVIKQEEEQVDANEIMANQRQQGNSCEIAHGLFTPFKVMQTNDDTWMTTSKTIIAIVLRWDGAGANFR